MISTGTIPEVRRIEALDVVCLGCGALCDDIETGVEGDRLIEARHACPIGLAWFLGDRREANPDATIDGRPCERGEAIDRAASILEAARRPIVLGLSGCSVESQSEAVALAERLGAAIDPGIGRDQGPSLRAFQRVGRTSATLGEVRNRADLVVFWGVDPVSTHPRHLERYSADPAGRFLPDGRADRTLIVVDREPTPTAEVADLFVPLPRDRQFAALWALRGLIQGVPLSAGVDPGLSELADRLRSARYSAIFFGPTIGGEATAAALFSLVRDLNGPTRSVALTLGGPGNPSGATSVLAWRSGFASGVDFSGGSPRSLPGSADADSALARGEVDAALVVADDPTRWLSEGAIGLYRRIPIVLVGPDATEPTRRSASAVASSRFGIDSGGSALRSDGVMLPVRPPLASGRPTEGEILRAIRSRIGEGPS